MTVVAWDGKTLAVDSQITRDDAITYMDKMWSYEWDDGTQCFVTGCGDISALLGLAQWYSEGAEVEAFIEQAELLKEASLIVLAHDNVLIEYEGSPYPLVIKDRHMAWGSGGDIALGALVTGSSASDAVMMASMYSASCGGNVLSINRDADEIITQKYVDQLKWV